MLTWLRDALLVSLPIAVGVGLLTYYLPPLLQPAREVIYAVDDPVSLTFNVRTGAAIVMASDEQNADMSEDVASSDDESENRASNDDDSDDVASGDEDAGDGESDDGEADPVRHYFYRVRIRNTGSTELRNLSVLYAFE